MHAVAAFVLVCGAGWLLIGALGRARSAAAARASGGGRGGQRTVRQEAKLAWEKVLAADWLEERRHERKNGGGTPEVAGETPARSKPALLQQMRAAVAVPFARRPTASPASSNGSTPAAPAVPARTAAASRPPPPPAPSGGNTTVAANAGASGAVEQLVDGVNQLHAHAQAGNVNAKHGAVKGGHEGLVRFAAMWNMLARSLGELGFGPEITEPIAKAAMHVQAGAMTISEADANLTTLLNMTLGEAAESPRQVPHHSQFAENGSR